MILPSLLLLKFVLFFGLTKATSENSVQKLKNKPQYSVGVEASANNDRSQRDAILTYIDYDSQRVVCDDNHPFFCDIIEPIKDKLKKSANVEDLVSKVLPFEVHKQNKKSYKSLQDYTNIKSMETLNSPNSDGFICAEYGFFPGIVFQSLKLC